MFYGVPGSLTWILLAVILAILEAETQGLVSLWFGIGAVVAFFSALLGAPPLVQVFVFVVVSALLLISLRRFAKDCLKVKPIKTNADRLVGERGTVLETIDAIKGSGQVKIEGKIWTAISLDKTTIMEGETVEVVQISGVKLVVKK
jgi:membrane protein implicated in regulation of membrane protease activity